MAKTLAITILLANLLMSKCKEDNEVIEQNLEKNTSVNGNSSYLFSYGVSNAHTADVKTAWEAKEGDTVEDHYSVLEPDGSIRTVEYSAGPKSGFKAVVTNKGERQSKQLDADFIEKKSLKDYRNIFHDFTENSHLDTYNIMNGKSRTRHPFDMDFVDYSQKKHPKYPPDLEPSEYTHSITIKHPYDTAASSDEAESHMGINFDPNCKTETKKVHNNDIYTNVPELSLANKQKYSLNPFSFDAYREEDNENYYKPQNFDMEKLPHNLKLRKNPKITEENMKPTSNKYKINPPIYEHDNYPVIPDIPHKHYLEDVPSRPKKKHKPHKNPEFEYPSDDLDEYILVPKKKFKQPLRIIDDYQPDVDKEYDHRFYHNNDEDRYHRLNKPTVPKEIVRKIVKKKRQPIFNLLDILDI